MAPYTQPRPRRRPRIIVGTLVGLFVLLLCYCSGVWWVVPPLRLWAINRVDRFIGRVDLVAPAGRAAGGGWFSPDGRHMVIGWDNQMVIWNLVTDERRTLSVSLDSMGWLDAQQFVVRDDFRYHIVEAATGAVTTVPAVPPGTYLKPGGFAVIEPLLQRADVIYSTQGWGGLYRLFVYADNQWSTVVLNAYEFGLASNAEVEALLATVPHQPIARSGYETPAQTSQRLTSPNGHYLARREGMGSAVITTRDGTMVARITKDGWIPVILGWAHDSSGIYVQFWIRGAAGAVRVPDKPLFKLTPLTPAEARWQAVRRVATPVTIVGGIAGAGWWWRRRTARR